MTHFWKNAKIQGVLRSNFRFIFYPKMLFLVDVFWSCRHRTSKKKKRYEVACQKFQIMAAISFFKTFVLSFYTSYNKLMTYGSVLLANTYQYSGKTILRYDHPDRSYWKDESWLHRPFTKQLFWFFLWIFFLYLSSSGILILSEPTTRITSRTSSRWSFTRKV